MKTTLPRLLCMPFLLLLMASCGGGGGGGPPPPPPETDLTWDEDNWNESDWQ